MALTAWRRRYRRDHYPAHAIPADAVTVPNHKTIVSMIRQMESSLTLSFIVSAPFGGKREIQ